MIGSSLKQYENTNTKDKDSQQNVAHEQYYANIPFDDDGSSEDNDDAESGGGYDSSNDISPHNLQKTLHSILCEEKEGKNSLFKSTPSPKKSGSYAIAAWDMQKSPMDSIFRQRFGGIDKPEISEVYDEFDDVESDAGSGHDKDLITSQESARALAKSHLNHVFRKHHNGIGEPELSSLNAFEDAPPAWEIPKSPYDGIFRKCHGGLSGSSLNFEGNEFGNPTEETVPAWSLPKSPLDSVFRKRVGGLGDSPSGVIDAQTGEFVEGKDFPPEELDGEIRLDDLPPNFGMSLRLDEQFYDSESEDGLQDIDVYEDAGSTDSEYRPGNLLTFDGQVDKSVMASSSQKDVISEKQSSRNLKRKKKVKCKKRGLKATSAADIALTSAWNALISPHSNFLKLEKSMTNTAARRTQKPPIKSSVSITVPTTSTNIKKKLKTRIAARRNKDLHDSTSNSQIKVEDRVQKDHLTRTTRTSKGPPDILKVIDSSISLKAKVPVSTSTIRRQGPASNTVASKTISSGSTLLKKQGHTPSSAPSRSSSSQPVVSLKGGSRVRGWSSTIPTRTELDLSADGLILVKDDIDPNHHPVVVSQQTRVSNYFEKYGVCEDIDSDESDEEDLDLIWRSEAFPMPMHGVGDTKNYSTFEEL
jgi:hypothetical protein